VEPTAPPTISIATPEPTPRPAATPDIVPATPAAAPTGEGLYRVQIGAFSSRENADERVAALGADGFSAYVVRDGRLFKVRVGAFRDRARAEELAQRLRAKGYDVIIVR
jgi:N-acetylmuramoyl-L-alanine amidase